MKTVFTLRRKLFTCCGRPLLYAVPLLMFLLGSLYPAHAQNKLVGDGFGGRKWYTPSGVTAGPISTANINGQLYMWGINTCNYILPIPYSASPTSWPLQGGIDVSGLMSTKTGVLATATTISSSSSGNIYYSGYTCGVGIDANTRSINPYPVQGFNNVKLVSSANGHMNALIKADSTGWVWGSSVQNPYELGGAFWGADATQGANNIYTPIKVINNAKFVSAGTQHIAFVKHDGTVWTLGDNEYGAYGDGTNIPNNYNPTWVNSTNNITYKPLYMSTTPVQMQGITNAVRVAVFGCRAYNGTTIPTGTVILKKDGTVWVAGAGGVLQSGNSMVPVQVLGLSNIVDIKCSYFNAMALSATGDVWVWGLYSSGMPYGDGTSPNPPDAFSRTFIPKRIYFGPVAAPMVAIEANPNGDAASTSPLLALDENHILYRWGTTTDGGQGNYSQAWNPVIAAKHVADMSVQSGLQYITRTTEYPLDERLWSCGGNGSNGMQYVHALNPDYYYVDPTGFAASDFVSGKYWVNNYNHPTPGLYYPCNPGAWGFSGMNAIASSAAGTIDCSKTQLAPAPVAGTASQADLLVTVNVTTLGDFTPTVTGSGFSLVDPGYVITPTALGTQQFHVPVKYDGVSSFSTLAFTVSPANPAAGCTLTLSGKKSAIVNIITSDCVPTVGPSLK